MRKIGKNIDIYLKDCNSEQTGLLSSSSPSSPSSPSVYSKLLDNKAQTCVDLTTVNSSVKMNPPSPVFSVDEIVNCIVKCLQEAELSSVTYWDSMSKFMLKYTITNIHNQREREYLKDFIMYKQYDECKVDKNPNVIKYGVFRHKCFNLMFRIDSVDDQISGEDIVSSTLLYKYKHQYQDIIRLGIVIPIYCHIKLSKPELFYSVQPYITNSVTFDRWIESIKHKSNFDEIVYDVLIQLVGILKELHEVDCVHGDIKPANILIVDKTQISVFLIDFGLSGIHEKTNNASGGTLPFCAPETYNTIANTRNGNNAIKYPQHFDYNWGKHNNLHDIWSLGLIFMTVYVFKHVKLYYNEYPSDFFLPSGYVSPNYLSIVKHEYIREMFSKHILVEPSKRCDISKLNDLILNLSFM
jgi:hypothetical protein